MSRSTFPPHLKQISDVVWKRHPWANDSCVLCWGVIYSPLVCDGFLSWRTQAPQGFLHDWCQTVYFTNIRWGSLRDAAFVNSYEQSSCWRRRKKKRKDKKKKEFGTILCLFEWNNQYFEPCFNHLLFETLDIFSCVAVECFFSAVQQT